jgi:hypothetical protein
MIEQLIEDLCLCLLLDNIQECRERLKEKTAITNAIWVNNASQNTDKVKYLKTPVVLKTKEI